MYMHTYKKEKMNLKSSLIVDLKNKKELSPLDDDFLKDLILDYFLKNKKLLLVLENHPKLKKSKEYKIVLKDLRKVLHEIYGMFQLKGNKQKLLSQLRNITKDNKEFMEIHKYILKTHRSTKERLNDYSFIYKKILDKSDKSILDIGAGINIFSFPWMNLNKVTYTALEFSRKDCLFLEEYFKIMNKFGLNGKAIKRNLLKDRDFPKADVVFLFKILDTLESLKKGVSKDILKAIKCKKLIVSFPTKTLSGKTLGKKRLTWFIKLIKSYKTFEIENEIFFIVKEKSF